MGRDGPALRASIVANVYEDVEAPAVFGLVAEWDSEVGPRGHLRSDAFGVLLGALELLSAVRPG